MNFKRLIPILICIFVSVVPRTAFAQCADPIGVAGEQIFNADHDVMQYCDGTNWVGWYPLQMGHGGFTCAGADWTAIDAPEANNWRSVTYGNGLFVAVAHNGTGPNRIMTSPDGVNWTARAAPEANGWFGVTYGNGLFVAVAGDANSTGPNRIMTSPDGVNWTAHIAPEDNNWNSVTYAGGLFVATASDFNSTGPNRIMTSPDGLTWTARAASETYALNSVTYGNGLFVAVVSGPGTTRVMTSPDGVTWTARTGPESGGWRSVTYGNGLFVAVSTNGNADQIMISPDGMNWTERAAPEDNFWNIVTYAGGLFVALASNGTSRIMTSPDGVSWTARIAPVSGGWYGVTYGNGMLVAVEYDGIMISECEAVEAVIEKVTDNLGDHTATQDLDMTAFNIREAGRVNFAGIPGAAPKSLGEIQPADPCETGAIGTVCTSDGAVYAGTTVGGARMYVADTDESGTYQWKITLTTTEGTGSWDDGLANTNAMLAIGVVTHPAAGACRVNRGVGWYLPAIGEFGMLYDNRAQLGSANLPTSTNQYWSSSEGNDFSAMRQRFSDGSQDPGNKNFNHYVRCVRR